MGQAHGAGLPTQALFLQVQIRFFKNGLQCPKLSLYTRDHFTESDLTGFL